MRAEIKQIRAMLQAQGTYDAYKQTFKNRKFRFLVTRICLIFNHGQPHQLFDLEQGLIGNPSPACFAGAFRNIKVQADWAAFGEFIYLIYKTSNYKYDKQAGQTSIFLTSPIDGNAQKRRYYNAWLHSLDFSQPEMNLQVRQLLRLVF